MSSFLLFSLTEDKEEDDEEEEEEEVEAGPLLIRTVSKGGKAVFLAGCWLGGATLPCPLSGSGSCSLLDWWLLSLLACLGSAF